MCDYIKKPCQHCPYRHDVKPFLTPERGDELAFIVQNPYTSFPCHKTTEHDDESDEGEMLVVETSKECAGFLTLRAAELGEEQVYQCRDGFKPSYDLVYSESYEMSDAYEEAAN